MLIACSIDIGVGIAVCLQMQGMSVQAPSLQTDNVAKCTHLPSV